MKPRVVLDTNVAVSALVFQHGRLRWIRTAWMAGRFLPLASTATVKEAVRVLAYPKFRLSADDIAALLADYVPFVETVEIPGDPVPVPEPPDPADRIFLELAEIGVAGFLVTGDRGLRGLSSVGNCRIVTPAEFRSILEGSEEPV